MGDQAAYWRKRVEAWSRSGLSQAEYCRRQGLQPVSFSWCIASIEMVLGKLRVIS